MQMGISRYNSEGYPDPTAHMAFRNMEADRNKFRIDYHRGYMELNLDSFFPCPQDKAKKVFRLIHRYSSETDKKRLLDYLNRRAAAYMQQKKESRSRAESASKPYEYNYHMARAREAEREKKMLLRNIKNFTVGMEDGE